MFLELLRTLRTKRWAHLGIINLRILLGFAFVPAGLKKILDQPFTDPANTGPFHDFLDAFQATGFFYQFVGLLQLAIAILLMTQTFAALGALMAIPMFTAICVFCWSSGAGMVTCVMVTLMLFGAIGLALWDFDRWRAVFNLPLTKPETTEPPPADEALWRLCGGAILLFYFSICLYSGGIYRPKGPELDNPAFWTLPLIALFPPVTFLIERRRLRSR